MKNNGAALCLLLALNTSCERTDPPPKANGPFGIAMGASPSDYPSCKLVGTYDAYVCEDVPKPHQAFENYLLAASAETGICKVWALGVVPNDNSYGAQTRERTEEIAQQIATVYGPWTTLHDKLSPAARWSEGADWLMALHEGERFYAYEWILAVPRNDVAIIMVKADAAYPGRGNISATFWGANFEVCKAARAKEKAKESPL
jgi:hypothetical protein